MLYYLIYISKASTLMDEDALVLILEQARIHNEKAGITGMLLYFKGPALNSTTGNFMQVLEGEEADIKGLYDKIKVDTRHHNVVLLIESRIDKRNFLNWSMGFRTVNTSSLSSIGGYVDVEDFYQYHSKPKEFNAPLNYLKTFYIMYS